MVALTLAVSVGGLAVGGASPLWAFLLYRSVRRSRAAGRAGLNGFVEQAARVSDEERERKLAALRIEVGDWRPGLAWLDEVDRRAAGRLG